MPAEQILGRSRATRSGTTPRSSTNSAWYGTNSGNKTHPVGEKRPNGLGLFDMHGNVWEWCWDGYDKDYYRRSGENDPRGHEGTSTRVGRGGGWSNLPRVVRSALRYGVDLGNRDRLVGFRVARGVAGG